MIGTKAKARIFLKTKQNFQLSLKNFGYGTKRKLMDQHFWELIEKVSFRSRILFQKRKYSMFFGTKAGKAFDLEKTLVDNDITSSGILKFIMSSICNQLFATFLDEERWPAAGTNCMTETPGGRGSCCRHTLVELTTTRCSSSSTKRRK